MTRLFLALNNILFTVGFARLLPKKPRHEDKREYAAWRMGCFANELVDMGTLGIEIKDRVIVDFGCAEGGKLVKLYGLGPARLIGLDIDEQDLGHARGMVSEILNDPPNVEIVRSGEKSIPLPGGCADVIVALDVLEHIADLPSIAAEWRRILKEDGKVFFKFQPFESPFGHHADRVLAVPWCQLGLTPEGLSELVDGARACHRRRTGLDLLPHPPYLNHFRLKDIISKLEGSGLAIEAYRLTGLAGNTNRWSRAVANCAFLIPRLRPYFCSKVTGVLRKHGSNGNDRR